jgi:hypothetical protein
MVNKRRDDPRPASGTRLAVSAPFHACYPAFVPLASYSRELALECMRFRRSSADVPAVRESCRTEHAREEKSPNGDWPQGLLSIGTLGDESPPDGGPRASQAADVPDFSIEEVKKLQDALNKLLRRAKSKSSSRGSGATDEDRASQLPLDRFLNCPSSLEVDRRISLRHAAGDGGEFSPDTQIILSKARDLLVSSNGAAIKHKSFKFLLKKMFACRGGFGPAPSLKDPVESRMEKVKLTALAIHVHTNYVIVVHKFRFIDYHRPFM